MTRSNEPAVFAQIVLSAGRSSRMGEPKALLRFGERSALELVLDAGASVAKRSIVVVSPDGASWRDRPRLAGDAIDWVINEDPAAEQIDSLVCGLRELERIETREEIRFVGFFIHPVDFPLSTSDDYARLAEAARDPRHGAASVLKPRWDGRHGHPVLCRRPTATAFLDAAATGKTARDVIRVTGSLGIDVENAGIVDDMDTPEDYRRLLQIFERGNG